MPVALKPSNLLQYGREICTETRLLLRVFWFLRHNSPSVSTWPTLRGIAKVQTLKLDFMVKKWRKKNLLGYFRVFPLYTDFKTVNIL